MSLNQKKELPKKVISFTINHVCIPFSPINTATNKNVDFSKTLIKLYYEGNFKHRCMDKQLIASPVSLDSFSGDAEGVRPSDGTHRLQGSQDGRLPAEGATGRGRRRRGDGPAGRRSRPAAQSRVRHDGDVSPIKQGGDL